jgi:hypothetical protein
MTNYQSIYGLRKLSSHFMRLVTVLFAILTLTINLLGKEKKVGPEWWSLQPIKKITPPKLDDRGLALNQVDAFIQKKLTENKLAPSKPASPRTPLF